MLRAQKSHNAYSRVPVSKGRKIKSLETQLGHPLVRRTEMRRSRASLPHRQFLRGKKAGVKKESVAPAFAACLSASVQALCRLFFFFSLAQGLSLPAPLFPPERLMWECVSLGPLRLWSHPAENSEQGPRGGRDMPCSGRSQNRQRVFLQSPAFPGPRGLDRGIG